MVIRLSIQELYLNKHDKYVKIYGKNTVILMLVGSFYELYSTPDRGPDLKVLSKVLDCTLTRKNKHITEVNIKNPNLLGFPDHQLHEYIIKLNDKNYTVIVVDQVTEPPNPKRKVVAKYTPGTYIENSDTMTSNNIISLYIRNVKQNTGYHLCCVGMSCVDVSIGKLMTNEVYSTNVDKNLAMDATSSFIFNNNPREIHIYNDIQKTNGLTEKYIIDYLNISKNNYKYFDNVNPNYKKNSYINTFFSKIYTNIGMLSPVEHLNLERMPYSQVSIICLLNYVYSINPKIIKHLPIPEIVSENKYLKLTSDAIYQLDITNDKEISIMDIVNNTKTAMGYRYLKTMITQPLIDSDIIQLYYDCVDDIINNNKTSTLSKMLENINDIEKIYRKLLVGILSPKEFCKIWSTIKCIPDILNEVSNMSNVSKFNNIDNVNNILKYLEKTFDYDKMFDYKKLNEIDGSFLNKGIDGKIDKLADNVSIADQFIVLIKNKLEKLIPNKSKLAKNVIQIVENKKGNHYFKMTKNRADLLKKNLTSAIKINDSIEISLESFKFKNSPSGKHTTLEVDEIDQYSKNIDEYKNQLHILMKDKFIESCEYIQKEYGNTIQNIIDFISKLDYFNSNSIAANNNNYVKPILCKSNNSFIRAKQLRHPLVERINEDVEYIPNDIFLGQDTENNDDVVDGMLIYGLNSSGKSVCMKSVGTAVIMAQAGMYVPSTNFRYCPYDSLFTRITGEDDIRRGLSSFSLEMTELDSIINRPNKKTLIIGDEVCKGTEHISGNSLVAATIIMLAEIQSSFIFTTHLHEIINLDEIKALDNVKAYHLSVEDKDGCLIFDRKLKEGSGESNYGITVAKHIIKNEKFIKLAESIKNKLLNTPDKLISDNKSKYNKNLYFHECGICKEIFEGVKNHVSNFDTHHINFQKDCKNGFVKSKPHMKMNSRANLIVLCKSCHHKVHKNEINIYGYVVTTKGKIVKFNKIDNQ